MPAPEGMTRDELIALVGEQVGLITAQSQRIAAQDVQITMQAQRIAELMEANEDQAGRLARLEHLLSRNSQNSSSPPSKDDEPGKPTPRARRKRGGDEPKRRPGKQSGAPGFHLAWTDTPDERTDRFPQGRCGCGQDLADATDLGVVDCYQQHEIPQVVVTVTQYDQHAVRCGCGQVRTADRPDGARPGPVGYGPDLQSFVVYLMVMQFVPAERCVALLESLTGTAPSVGFVHGLIARVAGLLSEAHQRIRALIAMAYVVSCDETPLRVGPRTPEPGKKKAEKYLLVACTELYTHFLLGDRSLETFKASVLMELTGSVIVHDRYQNYDSAELGPLLHQLCCAHLLRDLDGAAEIYPDAVWPTQIADALRGLIHQANLAREQDRDAIPAEVAEPLHRLFRQGVLVGLSQTTTIDNRPGGRKARLLLEVLRDREADVLRFTGDLNVPATSNQAERDLRPAKVQQKISGRLTSEKRTQERYIIRGYLATAIKHGLNALTTLRQAMTGPIWMPPQPAPT